VHPNSYKLEHTISLFNNQRRQYTISFLFNTTTLLELTEEEMKILSAMIMQNNLMIQQLQLVVQLQKKEQETEEEKEQQKKEKKKEKEKEEKLQEEEVRRIKDWSEKES